MFSNRYIYIYASVMVIIVAAALSTASELLKPYQNKNIENEKFQGILSAAEVDVPRSQANEAFEEYIVEELAINSEGDVVCRYVDGKLIEGDVRPFNIVLKEELKLKKDFKYGKARRNPKWPLYIMDIGGELKYVVPLQGVGLWGAIWGNIAFDSDFNTVAGTSFDHKSETPGLGAEINTKEFQNQFKGKQIFDQNGNFVSVSVVKGGVANSAINPIHGVDAVSGGTITSNGTSEMLKDCIENYVSYIKKNINNNE